MHCPFNKIIIPETEILVCARIDLWGPAQVQLTGGKIYMMLINDGGSSHTEVYFPANKLALTMLQALQHYHHMAKKQTRKTLKCIRMDGGGNLTMSCGRLTSVSMASFMSRLPHILLHLMLLLSV